VDSNTRCAGIESPGSIETGPASRVTLIKHALLKISIGLLMIIPAFAVAMQNLATDTPGATNLKPILEQIQGERVVYVGETHNSPADHQLQMQVLEYMAARSPRLAIGVEWFQQPYQAVVDAYLQGKIDESDLLNKTEYYQRWGFDYRFYRPFMQFARDNGIPIVALNASRELTDTIMRQGMDDLPPELQEQLPDSYDFNNETHLEILKSFFGLPHDEAIPEDTGFTRFLEVQLTWDETMAQNIAGYLQQYPDRQMLVFVGRGHSYHSAIPDRVARRNGVSGVSLLNYQPGSPFNIADHLVTIEARALPPQGKLGVAVKLNDDGIYIQDFTAGNLAEEAGVERDDKILEVDEQPVRHLADIKLQLIDKQPGDSVSLLLQRAQTGPEVEPLRVTLELIGQH
jgi:uncharacterized iron-regulated protein